MGNLGIDVSGVTPFEGADNISDQPHDTERQWSSFQTSIFAFVESGTGNAIVEAVAGSGKSTTIVEAMKLVRGQAIFLAFNKAIADELKARGVNARTFHSLCFGVVLKSMNAILEMDKLKKLIRENISLDSDVDSYTAQEERLYGSFAMRLVGLAKQVGMGFLTPDTFQAWVDICAHHDIEPESEAADLGRGIEIARHLLNLSNADRARVDFDDMLYIAVRDRLSLPKFDFIFVDEAQDTNMIQREILRMIMRPNSRMVAVGDPAQAIYGFRGADARSLHLIADEFKAQTLPLSISYRCATSVVSYAQQWVDHIMAREGAPEGQVIDRNVDWSPEDFSPNDLVVCRKTAPLISLAFKCIRFNVPAQVMGRDIGQGLKALIKKMNAPNIDKLYEKLQAYQEREVQKAMKDDDERKAESVRDRVGSLLFLIDALKEDRRDLQGLDAGIDYLFKDKANSVKLATIHKSKGLEADTVWWLGRSECPARWARQEWQQQEEIHLCYVAATRAKTNLYLIEDGVAEA
jgi:DNA helicase-2/ATP-dependent DNA helicase PcrA